MLMVLYGEEPYGVKYFLNSEMRKMDLKEEEIVKGELNEAMLDDIYSVGLFGRKYFLVSARDLKNPVIEKLLGDEPENEVRVVVDLIDKRLSVYNRLERDKKLKIFNRLSEGELKKFVLSKLPGMKIMQSDFDYLVERIGYLNDESISLYTVEIWLMQLRSSCEVITKQDIDFYIPKCLKENVFALFSYFLSKDKEKFFELLLQLLQNGENEINLLSTLLYSFRLSYKVALVGRDDAQIQLKISPYQLKNVPEMDPETARKAITILTEGIRLIKGGCDPVTAVIASTASLFTL